jgi:preprotein translocase subunit SecG
MAARGNPPPLPPFFFRSNRLLEAQAEFFFGAKADLRTLTQFQFFLIFNFLTIETLLKILTRKQKSFL